MSLFRGDASEVYALANDLFKVSKAAVPAVRAAMDEAGRGFADDWANNAREHFRQDGHAKRYPDSIDSELVFTLGSVAVDVGPNANKKQGFLGRILEFGGEKSPAYLDGLRAADTAIPRGEALIDQVIAGTFVATPVANSRQLLSYTTKAGKTRLATQAQVDNWTRGSRS